MKHSIIMGCRLLALCAAIAGCNSDECDMSISACNTEECYVISADRLESEGCLRYQPAGCGPRVDAPDAVAAARRKSDGSCWQFRSLLFPEGFAEDREGCGRVFSAPTCP